jgi:hypothetical protein
MNIPAFMALAARSEHFGHEEDAVAKVDSDDPHTLD